MKILYIALKYDYGDPKRGHSFEHYNFYDSLVKMDSGSHDIVYFAFDEVLREKGQAEMNKALLHAVDEHKPDICFFFLFTDEITPQTIKKISAKTVTVNWFADDHWRFANFSRHYAPYFNWITTTDSRAPEKYKAIGYSNVIKTQWACNHFTYAPPSEFDFSNPNYEHDVAFVGQPHSNRRATVADLLSHGINVECWGNGWPKGKISQQGMMEVFARSKINLNLTKSSSVLALKPLAKIFVSRRSDDSWHLHPPHRWIDNAKAISGQRREQIKGRNFEIPGCGGFVLTSDADNLRDYYVDGKEVVIMKNQADGVEKIRYYLAHDDERKAIARAGYERTMREHTYEKRFREIFSKTSR